MKRLNSILLDSQYKLYLNNNIESEFLRIYCKHPFEHMLDVARIAYILMLEENILETWSQEIGCTDKGTLKEIIYSASLLHDIGRWRQYATGESHSEVSAIIAQEFLAQNNFTNMEIIVIIDAIRDHRNSTLPRSTLGRVLQLADNYSRLCFNCEVKDSCNKLNIMKSTSGIIY